MRNTNVNPLIRVGKLTRKERSVRVHQLSEQLKLSNDDAVTLVENIESAKDAARELYYDNKYIITLNECKNLGEINRVMRKARDAKFSDEY